MAFINEHYRKLRGGYLFREIAWRVKAFASANPRAAQRIIHCGIGDVSEPLPPVAVEAMHRAVDDLADRETFRGYGPPSGYAFLRDAIARAEFEDRGLEMSPDEIFVSEGSKGDYLTNARILREGCEALGLSVYGGANAPYVWVACPDGVSSWQMFDRLLHDANVVVTPGIGFGRCGEGYVRISAFNTRENVEEAVERIKDL